MLATHNQTKLLGGLMILIRASKPPPPRRTQHNTHELKFNLYPFLCLLFPCLISISLLHINSFDMVIEYGNRPTGNTKIKVTFVHTYVIIFKATPPLFCIHYNKSLWISFGHFLKQPSSKIFH